MTYLKVFIGLALAFTAINILWYNDNAMYGIEVAVVVALALTVVIAIVNMVRSLIRL